MASLSVNVDFSRFQHDLEGIINTLNDKDGVFREIAVELTGVMHERIHEDGLASDGKPIGTYSEAYLNKREKNKLGSDSRIILVFTRKTSNSWGAFATEKGWAVGFVDDGATDGITARMKIQFTEERIGRKILDNTKDEKAYIARRIVEIVEQKLRPYANIR